MLGSAPVLSLFDQPDLPESCARNVMKDETKDEAKDARHGIRTFPESGARSNAQNCLTQLVYTQLSNAAWFVTQPRILFSRLHWLFLYLTRVHFGHI